MWVEDYKWHYDYVRLAWDTGFSFDKWKSPCVDTNRICMVDIDRIVRERDVASVDRFISTVVQYLLDDEQAKVLDINFVKIFRLSQLAVEFLLFCKKYLDNTVVLLKKELTKSREENKELKTFVDDLQSHIDTLTRQQALATFKCSICTKAFSSEEYLNAHVKRRHTSHNSESYNLETDKLNMEIKHLKERLNNTEKLLKEKEEQSDEKVLHDSSNSRSKVDELLEKFEQFKEKVNVELKELKMQKSFYEENCGRLFDIMINSKANIEQKYDNMKEISKAETTTQTDKLLHIESVHNRNVLEIIEPFSASYNKAENQVLLEGESSLKEIKNNIEAKISASLAGIEGQMQTFLNKLSEIEKTTNVTSPRAEVQVLNQTNAIITNEIIKPNIKPRSKFSQPTRHSIGSGDTAKNIKLAINELEKTLEPQNTEHEHFEKQDDSVSKHHIPRINSILPETLVTENLNSDGVEIKKENLLESQTSESESSILQKEIILAKSSALTSGKQSSKSFTKLSCDKEVLKHLNKEIREVVFSRLQELGISRSWPGLPQRSFEKSLEILNHQGNLIKKTYSNFDIIKKKIDSNAEKCARTNGSKIRLKTTPGEQNIKGRNVVKISCRPKFNKTTVNHRNVNVIAKRDLEIKNRALYDTDTESENNPKPSGTEVAAITCKSHQMYLDVVNEFKSLPTVKLQREQDLDMDDLNKKEDLQKGVLKSFPSVGSLSKKKVLFDLDSKTSKTEEAPLIQKTGGSTTSVGSSILEHSIKEVSNDFAKHKEKDEAKNKENDNVKEKDSDDLSDCDLSDL